MASAGSSPRPASLTGGGQALGLQIGFRESAMFKRTLIFGAALFVLVSAVIISLAVLGILSFQEATYSLRNFLVVVALWTVAIILLHKLYCLARQESSDKNSSSLKTSGPSPTREKSDSE
jgi:hypothetical protein